MRIGLISDTHIPDHASMLPPQLEQVFSDVELILHAGDIYAVSVLDELERLAPVLAAEGDDDSFTTRSDKRVKWRHVLNIDGVIIWLAHERPWTWTQNPDEIPDVVVFGHTHSSLLEKKEGILFVSPGSATFPHYKSELGTVAILTINSGKAEASIVQLRQL